MTKAIALALTIAAISTSAAAQQQPLLNESLKEYLYSVTKPYEAKTTPPDPNAPAEPARPVDTTRTTFAAPSSSSNSLLDGCVITAIGRLPKADGLKVVGTAYELRASTKRFDYYTVAVLTELNGRRGQYQWTCRTFDNVSAVLLNN
jgi:hypothetical protein